MLYKQRFWQLCKCAAESSVLQCMNGSILHKLGATKLKFKGDNLLGESSIYYKQGWQVCDGLVKTAGKNTVITGSSQTTTVVTNCHKPSQTQKSAKRCADGMIYLFNVIVRHFKHNLAPCNT